jgi:hypothetical protein
VRTTNGRIRHYTANPGVVKWFAVGCFVFSAGHCESQLLAGTVAGFGRKKTDSRFQVPFIYTVPAVELNFGYNSNASYSTTNILVWRPRFDS